MRDYILIYINSHRYEVRAPQASMMLADFLRYHLSLVGTKIVCAEGDCGACTGLRSFGKKKYQPINACIVSVAQMDGSSITTIELSQATDKDNRNLSIHKVQQAMIQHHGSQCGFCTPGMVMTLTGLVETSIAENTKSMANAEKNKLSDKKIKNSLTGNLCRCTGYQPIIDSAKAIVVDHCLSLGALTSEEKELRNARKKSVYIKSVDFVFFAPTSIREALKYLKKHSSHPPKIIAGGTDMGVLINKNKIHPTHWLSLHLIAELGLIKKKGSIVLVGAMVTVAELRVFLKNHYEEVVQLVNIFASPQIKNMATVVGNLANASPIGDMPPFLLVSEAVVEIVETVEIRNQARKRQVLLDQFYLDYKKIDLKKDEIISGVHFKLPGALEDVGIYKISQRKDLDISTVHLAIRIKWRDKQKTKLENCLIAAGGVAATPIRFKKTEKLIIKNGISSETLPMILEFINNEINPVSDLRMTAQGRRLLIRNLFIQFCLEKKIISSLKEITHELNA